MRDVLMNADGELVCPHCGAKQQFSYRRTAVGKVAMGVSVGLVGALALPKRLQCLGCQEYLRSRPQPVPGDPAPGAIAHVPRGDAAFSLPTGPVQVLVTDCEWTGQARVTMLKAARPGLRDHAYERMAAQIRKGEPAPVAAVTSEGAQVLAARLVENGFSVAVLEPEADEDV